MKHMFLHRSHFGWMDHNRSVVTSGNARDQRLEKKKQTFFTSAHDWWKLCRWLATSTTSFMLFRSVGKMQQKDHPLLCGELPELFHDIGFWATIDSFMSHKQLEIGYWTNHTQRPNKRRYISCDRSAPSYRESFQEKDKQRRVEDKSQVLFSDLFPRSKSEKN